MLNGKRDALKAGKQTDFPGGPAVRNPPDNAGDTGLIPERSSHMPEATKPVP